MGEEDAPGREQLRTQTGLGGRQKRESSGWQGIMIRRDDETMRHESKIPAAVSSTTAREPRRAKRITLAWRPRQPERTIHHQPLDQRAAVEQNQTRSSDGFDVMLGMVV